MKEIATCLLVCMIAILFVFITKDNNTYRNRMKIEHAIFRFRTEKIEHDERNIPVDYDDMEDYKKTLFRIWDWGCSRILPPEKMDLIRPYIK